MSELDFLEVDAGTIQQELIQEFETALRETLYPADERRIFLMQQTPLVIGLKNEINESAKQNLLRYAKGENLDALGEFYDTPRLQAQKSVTTFKWTLSAIQPEPVIIEKGNQATPDGELYFETDDDLVIPAGQAFGTVKAVATEAGAKYNGFSPGQIKNIVKPIPYVASVENIDTSSGGADIEPDDDGVNVWSEYRERIRQAPERLSTAGPRGAYAAWAKSADANIQDIAITSSKIKIFNLEAFLTVYPEVDPTPFYTERPGGDVTITVLMKNGESPSQDVLDKVNSVCSEEDRRPLNDHVTVQPRGETTYNIELTYYIAKERKTEETVIRNAIEGTGGALEQYKLWQSSKLGRAINPDYLRNLMLSVGAFRIEITSPVYTSIDADKVPIVASVTVNYGGMI